MQRHGPTCGEGHEGISSDKTALVIQKVGGVESVWRLPFVFIIQNGSEEGGDQCSLWADRTSEEQRGNINMRDLR